MDANGPTEDAYTNEWYRKQFQQMHYHWTRSMTEEAELQQQVRLLRKEVSELAKQRQSDMARIGELQERLNKASEVVAELKKARKEVVA